MGDRPHRLQRRLVTCGALVAAVAATLIGPAVAGAQTESDPAAPASVQVIEQAKRVALKGKDPGVVNSPWDLAVTPNAVWVLEPRAGEVQRIDPDTNRVVARVKLPASSCPPGACGIDRMVADAHDVWLTNNGAGLLVHIDARTNKVVGQTAFSSGISEPPVIDATGAWINSGTAQGDIVHVDGRTHKTTKTVNVGRAPAWPVAMVDGTLWAAGLIQGQGAPPDEAIFRIDPKAGRILGTVPGVSGPGVVDGDDVWLNRTCCPLVTRVDGHTGATELDATVDGGSIFHAAGDGSVFVRLYNQDQSRQWIERFDANDGTHVTTYELPVTARTGGIGFGHGSLWVTDAGANAVYRVSLSAS